MADRPAVGEQVGIARGPYGCGSGNRHWVLEPAPGESSSCRCGTVTRVAARDRYCIQRAEANGFTGTCYCGRCPHYKPVPPVNYRAAVTRMIEEKREKERRRRAELQRLSGQRGRSGHWSSKPR